MKKTKKLLLIFLCVSLSSALLTGCETLRKKFTRKRKTTDNQEQVIIVPRDYNAHPFPSDVLYKQYFIYWKSWNQELITSLTDESSYRKVDDCVEQAVINLRKMSSYLDDDMAKKLGAYVKQTEDLKGDIEASRNMMSSQRNLFRYRADRILSSVNRLFDLHKMKDHLK